MSAARTADTYLIVARGFADKEPANEANRRSAALMARVAVERALDDYWSAHRPDMTWCSRATQLLCLRELATAGVATKVDYAWRTLSNLCHYRAYEITPTGSEIANAIDRAADAVAALRS